MKISGLILYSSPFKQKLGSYHHFKPNKDHYKLKNKSYIANYFFFNDFYYLFICDYQLHLIKA